MSKGERHHKTRNVNKTKKMETKNQINELHIWWVIVIADRLSSASRKRLEAKGFSGGLRAKSFKRHCPSLEKAKEMQDAVQECLRAGDRVDTLLITDKQFGMMKQMFGH